MASSTVAAAELCAQYITEHGFLDADIDSFGTILVPSGVVDAIYLPHRLGECVIEEMDALGLFSPVVENISNGVLTVLTDGSPTDTPVTPCPTPERPAGPSAVAELRTNAWLFRCQAIRTVRVSRIPLPGPTEAPRRWRKYPRGRDREAFATIAELAISVGGHLTQAG
ncbi:hypothetical protein [Nocardia donostiensis]|uniref:Uncharacterized protein n=1 Tax=Nocardia donostiensis TaxID=1538463 RepID=A0A1V2TBU6_9NOCA|nr:hypothetical protein [Nocardia donostiensis]ONM46811.1 hypothetical protein B0T46_21465 [Nocardia donostiensis]OQS19569.1 hypothetical protein B0T44_13290 [Nocardia donostiensis]